MNTNTGKGAQRQAKEGPRSAVGMGAAYLIALFLTASALAQTTPADAVRTLREAVRRDPGRAETRYQLGLAYRSIGDLADAEAELREALRHLPDSAPAHNYLGIVLF